MPSWNTLWQLDVTALISSSLLLLSVMQILTSTKKSAFRSTLTPLPVLDYCSLVEVSAVTYRCLDWDSISILLVSIPNQVHREKARLFFINENSCYYNIVWKISQVSMVHKDKTDFDILYEKTLLLQTLFLVWYFSLTALLCLQPNGIIVPLG